MQLFDYDFPPDQSPPDDTEVKQVMLYFSEEDQREFKQLAKIAMRAIYGDEAPEKGNISDIVLKILKEKYGKVNLKEKAHRQPSGSVEGNLFDLRLF